MRVVIKSNLRDKIKETEKAAGEIRRLMPLQIFRALTLIEAQAKHNIRQRMNVISGSLLNSIQKNVGSFSGDQIEGYVASEGVPYAGAQEFGHVYPARFVAPRNKLALKWSTGGGNFAFSKGHRIPSFEVKPKYYLRDAIDKYTPVIEEELGLFIDEKLRGN